MFAPLNDDILIQIVNHLDIMCTINLLLTSKNLYDQRKILIENNQIYIAYKHVNKTSIIYALLNSDIEYDLGVGYNIRHYNKDNQPMCIKILKKPSSYEHIYNTYKLIVFNNIYNDVCVNKLELSNYYMTQLKLSNPHIINFPIFPFNRFLGYYNWNYTNINLYDVYQCMCYTYNKKYRIVESILNNMIIEPPVSLEVFVAICQTLIGYINSMQSYKTVIKMQKAVIITILYKFIDNVPSHINITEKLKNAIITKSAVLSQHVDEIKGVPRYIKNLFKSEYIRVSHSLSLK